MEPFFGLSNKDFIKRRALPIVTLLAGLIAFALLLLLSKATSNTEFFDNYFIWLYAANIVVGILLLLTIIILAVVISIRWRKGRFGTRLIAKLAMIFALVGVVPGIILYSVSWQFVSKSIETWFDVKVESALNSGLELGRVTLRIAQEEILAEGKFIAEQIVQVPSGTSSEQVGSMVAKIRNQFGIQEVSLFNMQRTLILSTEARPKQFFPAPSSDIVAEAFKKSGITFLDEIQMEEGQPGYRVRAIVPIVRQKALPTKSGSTRYIEDKYFLQLVRFIPKPLAKNIYAVESAYSEYQEKALGRVGLRKMYIGTLTLTLFFALFVAVTLALLLGRQLAQPLLMLLKGTQAVAQGDLSPKPELDTGDELGMLTRQFNVMTKQLSDARDSLQESKAFLETVLGNLTAGVCIFNNNFNLASSNPGAAKILGCDLSSITGKPLGAIPQLADFEKAVRESFTTQHMVGRVHDGASMNLGKSVWQKQIQIHPVNEYENDLGSTLFVRGTQLSPSLKMIVFDDISDVIAAQRSIAWSEVARRLAHEIKNPLTPIQLSAERLQQKLLGKLGPEQDEMIERSTSTIIGQVQAMKQMVNEFRDFAKTPSPTLGSLDLNTLIKEVMGLYEGSRIQVRLDSSCPRIMGDPTQLRQVIHNLLQNAQDASLEAGRAEQLIEITTELVQMNDADQNRSAVRMTIADSGPGFQAKILARAFEPYITTKAKGTGLGLAVVKKIIDDHGAKIEIRNRKQGEEILGAQVSILFLNLAKGVA
jgi:nitrogen fixation/metabolism regulation signal transduction histidine kinase